MGYGVIDNIGNRFNVIDYGAICTSSDSKIPDRLVILYNDLKEIIEEYQPEDVAVEELFFNKNIKTALTVGHARGVAILAAANMGKNIYEYTPLQVKQAVVGYGRAKKQQVQEMTKILLNLPEVPKPDDVADALAVAICHCHSVDFNNLINKNV